MKVYSLYFIIKALQEDMIRKYAHYLKGKVLDAGCGMRPYKGFLVTSNEYVGMDGCLALKPDVVGRAQDIPFKDESFDSVLCTEVLEHLPEVEAGIKQIKRVLKKRGVSICNCPSGMVPSL